MKLRDIRTFDTLSLDGALDHSFDMYIILFILYEFLTKFHKKLP